MLRASARKPLSTWERSGVLTRIFHWSVAPDFPAGCMFWRCSDSHERAATVPTSTGAATASSASPVASAAWIVPAAQSQTAPAVWRWRDYCFAFVWMHDHDRDGARLHW